jgi:hypothetical protein
VSRVIGQKPSTASNFSSDPLRQASVQARDAKMGTTAGDLLLSSGVEGHAANAYAWTPVVQIHHDSALSEGVIEIGVPAGVEPGLLSPLLNARCLKGNEYGGPSVLPLAFARQRGGPPRFPMKLDCNGKLHLSPGEQHRLMVGGEPAKKLRQKANQLMRNYEARQQSKGYQKVRYFSRRPEVTTSVP